MQNGVWRADLKAVNSNETYSDDVLEDFSTAKTQGGPITLPEVIVTASYPEDNTDHPGPPWEGGGYEGEGGGPMDYPETEPYYENGGQQYNDGPTPCEQANELALNTEFKEKFALLKSKTNQNKEYGYVFKIATGTSITETAIEGEANAAEINFSISEKIDGGIHSHYTNLLSVFSPADIYAMANIYLNDKMVDPLTFTEGLVTASGTQYLLKIYDLTKFQAFAENLVNNIDVNLFSQVYNNVYGITPQNTKEQNEKRFLQFIEKTNSGLKLFKGNENFIEWQPKKVDENANVVNNPC